MGIQRGIAAVKAYKEEIEARRAAAEAGKINWLKMEDGESVDVWFLQELDESAENYLEANGIGIFATEHTKPGKGNFQTKALCSMDDEEQCLGCELHRKDWKAGWKAKSRLYINVLVKRKNGDLEVAVMSQSNGPKGVIAPMLLETAVENNTITDRWWKITRSGENEGTVYTPFPRGPSNDVNPADYSEKIFDLNRCVRSVPYVEQEAFFLGVPEVNTEADTAVTANAGSTGANDEW